MGRGQAEGKRGEGNGEKILECKVRKRSRALAGLGTSFVNHHVMLVIHASMIDGCRRHGAVRCPGPSAASACTLECTHEHACVQMSVAAWQWAQRTPLPWPPPEAVQCSVVIHCGRTGRTPPHPTAPHHATDRDCHGGSVQ